MCLRLIAAVCIVLVSYGAGFGDESLTPPEKIERETRDVAGWTVHIDHRLVKAELKATVKALPRSNSPTLRTSRPKQSGCRTLFCMNWHTRITSES